MEISRNDDPERPVGAGPARASDDPASRSSGPPAPPDGAAIRSELGLGGGLGADPDEVETLLRGALEGFGDLLPPGGAISRAFAAPGSLPSPPGAERIDPNLELLRDVHLRVRVELGRGRMELRDILRLGHGSVVELERQAGDPLDICVDDQVIARGEVLVLDENFCIRITQVLRPEELRRGT